MQSDISSCHTGFLEEGEQPLWGGQEAGEGNEQRGAVSLPFPTVSELSLSPFSVACTGVLYEIAYLRKEFWR